VSFQPPTYNLVCNIWHGGVMVGPPDLSPMCNLAYGRRFDYIVVGIASGAVDSLTAMQLLLPRLTDIRGPLSTTGFDLVECPAGTGRLYSVACVDDSGKGFGNEHRIAILYPTVQPTPLP
jgi:hypothetical protein